MADLILYLGLHSPVSEIITKLELVYGIVALFNVFMQNFYKLQQENMEKVPVYVTQFEGALNAVQQEYPNILNADKIHKHLRDCLFHGLHKQLCKSMYYPYDDQRVMYPLLLTAACKTVSV